MMPTTPTNTSTFESLPSDTLLYIASYFETRSRCTALLPSLSPILHSNLPPPPLRVIIPSAGFDDLASKSRISAPYLRGQDLTKVPEIWVQEGTYSIDLGHLVSECPYIVRIFGQGIGKTILHGGITCLPFDGQINCILEDLTLDGRGKVSGHGYALFTHSKYTETRFIGDIVNFKINAFSNYYNGSIVRVHNNGKYDIKLNKKNNNDEMNNIDKMQLNINEKNIEGGNGNYAHSEVHMNRVEVCYYKYGGIYIGSGANVYLKNCLIHHNARGVTVRRCSFNSFV